MQNSIIPEKFENNETKLPSISIIGNNEDSTDEKMKSMDNLMMGDKVETLSVDKETHIEEKNFVIDFSEIENVSAIQLKVIKSIVDKEGDTSVYIYNKKKGLILIGVNDKFKLERCLPSIKKYIFDNKIRIFRDFEIGKRLQEVEELDISLIRLNL
jgi:hypothetical protein